MRSIKNITLIGAGNVGTNFAYALYNKSYNIEQIYSYNAVNAQNLAENVNAHPISTFDDIKKNSDLYILCIKDDMIPNLGDKLKLNGKFVVHTAGSVPKNAISNLSERNGVLYPLQTFSKNELTNINEVPLLIEAAYKKDKNALYQFAMELSNNVHEVNTEQRNKLHLAAVFTCNFVNHMLSITDQILKENDLNRELLFPLLNKTIDKAKSYSPVKAQTGPAIRNDRKTIEKHLNELDDKKGEKE
ncbi:MAG: Rossmann-like and DUF2520 domain-containing protein, partial [Flavobacteriales bacterium]